MAGAFQSSAFQDNAFQTGVAAFTGGGGHKERKDHREWTRGFFKIPEEYRERIEETLEEAAQSSEPVTEVKKSVAHLLRLADVETERRKEYVAAFAEAYRELLMQKQEEEEEMAQVIALVLLH